MANPAQAPLLRVLRGERVDPPPVWLMRQAGRYLPDYHPVRDSVGSFLELCFAPEKAATVTLQPVERFGLDAAILFSDILVVPWALDVGVAFHKGTGPQLKPLSGDPGDLPADAVGTRLAPVYDTVARVCAALPASCPVIGFAGAPWTLACYMLEGGGSKDFPAARRYAYEKPDAMARLMARLETATIAYLDGQIAAGAQAVKLFDSWAGVLAPALTEELVIASHARIVAALKARHPGVPVIGFPRGIGAQYARYAWASGVDAVALDTAVAPSWAAANVQARKPVQGQIDPMALAVGGQALARAVAEARAGLGSGPWIANLGHGVLPDTPPEHVAALVAALRGEGDLA